MTPSDNVGLRPAPERSVSGSGEVTGTLEPSAVGVGEHPTPATPVLPDAVIAKVASRLGIISLMYAVSFAVVHLAVRFVDLPDYWREGPAGIRLNDATALLFVALSVVVFAVARGDRLARERLVFIGLVYEIVAAFGIEIATVFFPSPEFINPNGISWSCVLIVIFPLIVPTTTRQTLVAASAAAAMRPLAFGLLALDGVPLPPAAPLFLLLLPNFLCVGVAVIAARVVNEFGADLSRARSMGSYQLVERLGEGGMGEVWRATHRLLARPAAIKLIRPERLGSYEPTTRSTLRKRFEREARATAALSSPHTIQLHDYGTTGDGVFYYVMELLHGLDLGDLVQRFGPQPPNRVVHIMRQVCRSLAEAHATGLVHRDIKPENIYLCRIGLEYDFVKVLDFGLVKSVEHTGTALTLKNVATGTPAFMAPEIALAESIDGRADIYALGCVAYWLLSGQLVFTAPNPMRAIFAHINTSPERVSGRTELPVPPELEDLVMMCLEKQPDHRPQTAEDLLQSLSVLDLGTPWSRERATDWWRAHLPELVER